MTMTQPHDEKVHMPSVQLAIDSAMDRAARLTGPGAEPVPQDAELITLLIGHLGLLLGPAERWTRTAKASDKAREIAAVSVEHARSVLADTETGSLAAKLTLLAGCARILLRYQGSA
ncbi:hypothetical protein [Streptomyces sp. NPDC047108]|uniref:hypothetical protein n=1 Tax=Streptomyces sp. NPDC047108 TaxID=3155025 RepID=UPI0033D17764